MKQILIIEDDKTLSNGIKLSLQGEKINIMQVFSLNEAKTVIDNNNFDLLILDINLPDGNGINYLKELRKTNNINIILLTANDLEIDIVTGLETGADDYITKPFSLAVLRARVNNQLRDKVNQDKIIIDNFEFTFDSMEFYKNDERIELSKTEQKLLKVLIDNAGMVLSRDQLINIIWDNNLDFVDNNALSVSIKRLRDKLEDNPTSPKYIKTVHGVGYMWGEKKQ